MVSYNLNAYYEMCLVSYSVNIFTYFFIDEVTGGWRKLHNEELHILYPSPSIIRIKSRRMNWAGHVA
jgi:hypothetical protein